MKNGTKPTKIDYRDRDFHLSFGTTTPQFPPEYFCDAGLTMYDQNADGQPFGCTNYSSADLATDLNKEIHNPFDLEAVTHANQKGGYDIRQSLLAAKSLGWIEGFYNIKAYFPNDFFDAFRTAQLSGLAEKRSITWGTPWFPSWEAAIVGNYIVKEADGSYTQKAGAPKQMVMPMPLDIELQQIRSNLASFGWHDSKLDGWTTKEGKLVYRDKSWQGENIGENGFIYFPREVINTVMSIGGTVGFTATNMAPDKVVKIDLPAIQWLLSYVRTLVGY